MKTLKAILTSALTAIMLSATTISSFAAENRSSIAISSDNPDIKKVIASGNIKVLIIQGKREWISLNEDEREKISIQQVGNTIRLSSTEKKPITITLYVKSPFRIEAANEATVRTLGNFNVPYLQVILKDNAVGRIKATTESLYTVLSNNSNLELVGSTGLHLVKSDGAATMKTEKFAALKTDMLSIENDVVASVNVKNLGALKMNSDSLKKTDKQAN